MMKSALLLTAATGLAACATNALPGEDVYRAQAVAMPTSMDCSRREASSQGYRVTWLDGAQTGTLRAERRFDANGPRPTRGYITVSVSHDPGDVMSVTAERVTETSQVPSPPSAPRPTPTPTPSPTPLPNVRRRAPERVSPGEVATHARNLLRRCAMGVISERRA
jgi:hypothetical protein